MEGSSPSYVVWCGVWCVSFDVSPEFCLLLVPFAFSMLRPLGLYDAYHKALLDP